MKIWMNNVSERGVSEWRHEVGIYGTEGEKKNSVARVEWVKKSDMVGSWMSEC